MYYDLRVPVPDVKGKIYLQKRNGVTYVQYEYDRVYHPEKKYNTPKRTTIGKVCEEDSSLMYPNPNYRKYFPEEKTSLGSSHHTLDIWPLPKEQMPMFINEPWLTDESIWIDSIQQAEKLRGPENEEENLRVYIPLDLNKAAFLRRLEYVLSKYKEITWKNESLVSTEVNSILSQLEIYDQLWFVREGDFVPDVDGGISKRSRHAKDAAREIIARLEDVDTCVDFPYEIIEKLKVECELV